MTSMTLEEAERVLQGAKAKALEMGLKVSVSVVDPRGDLVCMVRLDGAPWRTPAVSRGKARAVGLFRPLQRSAHRPRHDPGDAGGDADGGWEPDPRTRGAPHHARR